jgi:hypothetical protein
VVTVTPGACSQVVYGGSDEKSLCGSMNPDVFTDDD